MFVYIFFECFCAPRLNSQALNKQMNDSIPIFRVFFFIFLRFFSLYRIVVFGAGDRVSSSLWKLFLYCFMFFCFLFFCIHIFWKFLLLYKRKKYFRLFRKKNTKCLPIFFFGNCKLYTTLFCLFIQWTR